MDASIDEDTKGESSSSRLVEDWSPDSQAPTYSMVSGNVMYQLQPGDIDIFSNTTSHPSSSQVSGSSESPSQFALDSGNFVLDDETLLDFAHMQCSIIFTPKLAPAARPLSLQDGNLHSKGPANVKAEKDDNLSDSKGSATRTLVLSTSGNAATLVTDNGGVSSISNESDRRLHQAASLRGSPPSGCKQMSPRTVTRTTQPQQTPVQRGTPDRGTLLANVVSSLNLGTPQSQLQAESSKQSVSRSFPAASMMQRSFTTPNLSLLHGSHYPSNTVVPVMDLTKRGMFGNSPLTGQEADGDDKTPLASSQATFSGPPAEFASPAVHMADSEEAALLLRRPHSQSVSSVGSCTSSSQMSPPDSAGFSQQSSSQEPSFLFRDASQPARPHLNRIQSYESYCGLASGSAPEMTHSFTQPLGSRWLPGQQDSWTGPQEEGGKYGPFGRPGQIPSVLADAYNGGNLSLHQRRQHQHTQSLGSVGMQGDAFMPNATQGFVAQGHGMMNMPPPMNLPFPEEPPLSAASWAGHPSSPASDGPWTQYSPPHYGPIGMTTSRSMGMSPLGFPTIGLATETGYFETPPRSRNQSTSPFTPVTGSRVTPPSAKKLPKGGKANQTTPRKSASSSGLLPPLVVSSADKVHVCHCGKRFKRMEHLKRHNRSHTQERPHRCPMGDCGKHFGRSDNLAQHLKTHSRHTSNNVASQQFLAMAQAQAQAQNSFGPRAAQHPALSEAQAAASHAAAAAVRGAQATAAQGHASNGAGLVAGQCLGGPIELTHSQSMDPRLLERQQQLLQQWQYEHSLKQQQLNQEQAQLQRLQQHAQMQQALGPASGPISADSSPPEASTLSSPLAAPPSNLFRTQSFGGVQGPQMLSSEAGRAGIFFAAS